MQVAAAEEMETAPRGQELERARRGSVEFLGRWNDKRDDRAMAVKLRARKDRHTAKIDTVTMVRVALGKLIDELVQNGASVGILAIRGQGEFSWSASPDDVSYQRHGFVGMQSDQRQSIRFADFEGVVDDFGAGLQMAVYRVTLPSGGFGLNWAPKRHGTVSPALAERIDLLLLCAVRDRKRPHEERSLALLPNRILIHNIFSYLADVKSVKWVGRPPPPAPGDLYTGPRSDGLLSTEEISGGYYAGCHSPFECCISMTVAPLGPDAIETWRTGCCFLPCFGCIEPFAGGDVRTRNPGTNDFTNDFGGMTFSADGTASGGFKRRPDSQKRAFQKVDARDLAGTWFGCCCCPFVPFWPLSHVFCTTKKALNEDQYEESGLCCWLCLPIPVSGTRTRKYVNGYPTNGFDGYTWDGKPNVHWYRDPGCAGGNPIFAKKVTCRESRRITSWGLLARKELVRYLLVG